MVQVAAVVLIHEFREAFPQRRATSTINKEGRKPGKKDRARLTQPCKDQTAPEAGTAPAGAQALVLLSWIPTFPIRSILSTFLFSCFGLTSSGH